MENFYELFYVLVSTNQARFRGVSSDLGVKTPPLTDIFYNLLGKTTSKFCPPYKKLQNTPFKKFRYTRGRLLGIH